MRRSPGGGKQQSKVGQHHGQQEEQLERQLEGQYYCQLGEKDLVMKPVLLSVVPGSASSAERLQKQQKIHKVGRVSEKADRPDDNLALS